MLPTMFVFILGHNLHSTEGSSIGGICELEDMGNPFGLCEQNGRCQNRSLATCRFQFPYTGFVVDALLFSSNKVLVNGIFKQIIVDELIDANIDMSADYVFMPLIYLVFCTDLLLFLNA